MGGIEGAGGPNPPNAGLPPVPNPDQATRKRPAVESQKASAGNQAPDVKKLKQGEVFTAATSKLVDPRSDQKVSAQEKTPADSSELQRPAKRSRGDKFANLSAQREQVHGARGKNLALMRARVEGTDLASSSTIERPSAQRVDGPGARGKNLASMKARLESTNLVSASAIEVSSSKQLGKPEAVQVKGPLSGTVAAEIFKDFLKNTDKECDTIEGGDHSRGVKNKAEFVADYINSIYREEMYSDDVDEALLEKGSEVFAEGSGSTLYKVEKDGKTEAYMILREDKSALHISEILSGPFARDAGAALIEEAVNRSNDSNSHPGSLVDLNARTNEVGKIYMEKYGFLPDNDIHPFDKAGEANEEFDGNMTLDPDLSDKWEKVTSDDGKMRYQFSPGVADKKPAAAP